MARIKITGLPKAAAGMELSADNLAMQQPMGSFLMPTTTTTSIAPLVGIPPLVTTTTSAAPTPPGITNTVTNPYANVQPPSFVISGSLTKKVTDMPLLKFTDYQGYSNNKTTTTTTSQIGQTNLSRGLYGLGDSIKLGLGVGHLFTTQLENENKQAATDKRVRESGFTNVSEPMGLVGSHGDYTQQGIYNPKGYSTNKGMFTGNAPGLATAAYGGIIEESLGDVPLDVINVPSSKPMVSNALTSVDSDSSKYSNENYVLPVENFKISSGFGNRKAPKAGASTSHNGLDLSVPINSNVFAPMDGVVRSIYSDGRGGNQLIIEQPDGSKFGFAHLNGYKVKVGDNVNKGQVVALSGNTGNVTGPHLHFTYRNANGDLMDPSSIFDFGIKKTTGNDVSTTNNPLNIHYGGFAKRYGAEEGGEDPGSNGRISIFPDLNTGVEAAKNLLFGPDYSDLTISQARNKWVSGNPNTNNASTSSIVKEMGMDRKLSELSASERNKLFLQFSKWENRAGYDLLKGKKLFKEGGEAKPRSYKEGDTVELTEEEIKNILANGGDVEFI